MNQHNIRILLEKYFEGETNLQEEAQLADYFQQENIAKDLVSYKSLFQFYDQQKNITLSGEFDQRIQQENIAKDLVPYKSLFQFYYQQKNITLSDEFDQKNQQETTPAKRSRTVHMYRVVGRVAALLALTWLTYQAYEYYVPSTQKNPNYIVLDEEAEAKMAYQEIKAALMLVSSKMNEGTEKTASGLIKINQATEIVKQKD